MNFMNLNTGAVSSVSAISAIAVDGVVTDGASLFVPSFSESSGNGVVSIQVNELLGKTDTEIETSEKAISHVVITAPGIKLVIMSMSAANGATRTYNKNFGGSNEAIIHTDRLLLSRYFDMNISVEAADISGISMHIVYSVRTVRR